MKWFYSLAAKFFPTWYERRLPGFASLHRMIEILLAEKMPPDGHVLVLGAGGGMELKALADAQPGWTFDAVDPSADMLELAAETVRPHVDRVRLHYGSIEAAPQAPFDGASLPASLLGFGSALDAGRP